MWYFLGKDRLPDSLTTVFQPKMAFQESTTPRLCVAPSLMECILALSLEELFYVHSIEVHDPLPADHSVGDRGKTREHWITQEVLDRHGGSIAVKYIGRVLLTKELITSQLVAKIHGDLPEGWEAKELELWSNEHEFLKPRFHGSTHFKDLIRQTLGGNDGKRSRLLL